MNTQRTVKTHNAQVFNQFELTKNLINNLQQFNITPSAKLVLLYLSTCYNPNKSDIYPKQKTIANKIGISERSTVRAINELVKAGLILKVCNYTNRYKITSKIACKSPQNEKNFNSDKVSDTICKNDTKQYDNLSVQEQIKETNKEHDKKILEQYAIDKGISNITPYVNAILKNGNYNGIIRKYEQKKQLQEQAQARKIQTQEQIKQYKEDSKNASSPLDFNKEQAFEYVSKMPMFMRNTGFCKELIKKYSLIV